MNKNKIAGLSLLVSAGVASFFAFRTSKDQRSNEQKIEDKQLKYTLANTKRQLDGIYYYQNNPPETGTTIIAYLLAQICFSERAAKIRFHDNKLWVESKSEPSSPNASSSSTPSYHSTVAAWAGNTELNPEYENTAPDKVTDVVAFYKAIGTTPSLEDIACTNQGDCYPLTFKQRVFEEDPKVFDNSEQAQKAIDTVSLSKYTRALFEKIIERNFESTSSVYQKLSEISREELEHRIKIFLDDNPQAAELILHEDLDAAMCALSRFRSLNEACADQTKNKRLQP